MKGYDEKSTAILNDIADSVCNSSFDREVLQGIYELGLADGQVKQIKQIRQQLTTEATCDQTQ